MADVLTLEQRRKNMQHIKANDTKIEILLRKVLRKVIGIGNTEYKQDISE